MELFKLKELIFSLDLAVKSNFEEWNLKRFILEINNAEGEIKVFIIASLLIRLLGLKEVFKEHLGIIDYLACCVKEIDKKFSEVLSFGLNKLIQMASEEFSELKDLIKVLKICNKFKIYRKKENLSYINFKIENKLWSKIFAIDLQTNLDDLRCLLLNMIKLQNLDFNLENHMLALIPILSHHIKNSIEINYENTSNQSISLELFDLILKLETSSVTISQIAVLKNSLKDYQKPLGPISGLSLSMGSQLQNPIRIYPVFIPPDILSNFHTYIQFEYTSYGTIKTELTIEKTRFNVLIKIYDDYQPEALEMIYNEIKILQFLSENSSSYKNFLKLFGFNINNNRIEIVLENFENNLEKFILARNIVGFNESQLRLLFKSLIESFEFIEKNEICHQNICLENILIDPNWVLKISGFKTLHYNDHSTFQNTLSNYEGKFRYYPDCNRENLTWAQMVNNDIYALGVVFLQMTLMDVYEGGDNGGKLSLELEIEKIPYNWAKILISNMIKIKKFGSFTKLLSLIT